MKIIAPAGMFLNPIYRIQGDQLIIDQLDTSDIKVVHDIATQAAFAAGPGKFEGRATIRQTMQSAGAAAETVIGAVNPYTGVGSGMWALPVPTDWRVWLIACWGQVDTTVNWTSSQFAIGRPSSMYMGGDVDIPEVIRRHTAQAGDTGQTVNFSSGGAQLTHPILVPPGGTLRGELRVSAATVVIAEFIWEVQFLPAGIRPF